MDANTIRIILIVIGAVLILLLYLWERQRGKDPDSADDDRWDVDDQDDAAPTDAPYGIRHSAGVAPAEMEPLPPRSRAGAEVDVAEQRQSGRRTPAPAAAPPPASAKPAKPAAKPAKAAKAASAASAKPAATPAAAAPDSEPITPAPPRLEPLLIQVSVMSGRGHSFRGTSIMDVAESCGLHPGEMDIFHCLDEFEDETRVYFSMANLVKPGTFPFEAMDEFTTPGLVLFAQLRGRPEDMTILDEMIATARKLAISLRGDVLDDMRCTLTVKKQDEMRKAVLANQARWAKSA